jgi:hypothetical protein
VNAFLSQTRLGLLLAVRNRLGLLYGFLFPLLFLAAFRAIYRHEPAPLALHMGELLTVTVLGGACFGLPTTLVNERERGVWRRYRLTPASTWLFVASTLTTRYLLICAAALLQLVVALAAGTPRPLDPLGLCVAFSIATAAFLALGMVIAQLAPNVPAVQALGQCIFLPMLLIGGVGVPLTSLPDWALHASVFFPGRYAVTALQRCVTGSGGNGFELLCLLLIGVASACAAVALFRWDVAQRERPGARVAGIALALGIWGLVGGLAELQGKVTGDTAAAASVESPQELVSVTPGQSGEQRPAPQSWREVTPEDFRRVAFARLPPDAGLIAPIAAAAEEPPALLTGRLDQVRNALSHWPPAQVDDEVQRVRNVLYVCALPDLLQMSDVERYLPQIVFDHLKGRVPYGELRQILYWIALHPDAGDDAALRQMSALGLPDGRGPTQAVRARVMLYAFKLLGRMTGDIAAP